MTGTEGVFHEGELAFREDVSMIHNPYDKYSDCWYIWNDGWKQAWWKAGENTWRPK